MNALKYSEVQQVNVQRRRSLADDRLDGLVPPVAPPAHRLCCIVFSRQYTMSDDAASTQAFLLHHAHMTLTVCAGGVLSGCLLQTLCRRVLVARRNETLLSSMYAALLSRIAAEAKPADVHEVGYAADLLRLRLWPLRLMALWAALWSA